MHNHDDSDGSDVLLKARGGDLEACGQLFETYRSYLMLIAQIQIDRRLEGKADASDVVQETFLQAHRSLPCFRGSSEVEFLAWLRSMLGSKLAKLYARYLQTQARDVRLERQLEEELNRSSELIRCLVWPGSSPSQHVMRNEEAVVMAAALDQLAPDYRQVILLRHLEEMDLPQVATRMGRTVDSVRKLWVRSLSSLHKILEEQGYVSP